MKEEIGLIKIGMGTTWIDHHIEIEMETIMALHIETDQEIKDLTIQTGMKVDTKGMVEKTYQ